MLIGLIGKGSVLVQVVDRPRVISSVHHEWMAVAIKPAPNGQNLAAVSFAVNKNTGLVYGIIDQFDLSVQDGELVVYGSAGQFSPSHRDETLIQFGMELQRAELLVAHGLEEVRSKFLDLVVPAKSKPWLCSRRMIEWAREGVPGLKSDALGDIVSALKIPLSADTAMGEAMCVVEILAKQKDGMTNAFRMMHKAGLRC